MNEARYKMALQAILMLSGDGFWASARAIAKAALEGAVNDSTK
jgi:hypothetical protein